MAEFGVTLVSSITNPDVGDMALTDTGEEVLRTDLAEEVAQRLKVRLNFFRGEWFLNLNAGTPWYQRLLVKDPKDAIIRAIFTRVIGGTEGVAQVMSLSYDIDRRTRELSLRFRARLEDGSTFVSTDYPPFVVDL
jgi:hypothetical protein